MSKHTPGPWEASGLTVYDTCMDSVASVHSAADAHLIAAAPDMLETLEACLRLEQEKAKLHGYSDCCCMLWSRRSESFYENGTCPHQMARAAIAKAEGRP